MKYSQEHLYNMEVYSNKLNLPAALVHIAKTEYQADTLNEILDDCYQWSEHYAISQYNDLHDPYREYNQALKAKQILEEYLSKTDFSQMLLLNAIELPDNNTRDKPSQTIATFERMVREKLEDADFSSTTIKKEIMPNLRKYIKDDSLIK